MALDKRFFISFLNTVDDYPEIITYDTEGEMKAALDDDHVDDGYIVMGSGSYDYCIKTENQVNGSFRYYYFNDEKSMNHALENGSDDGVENLIYYGKVEDEKN